MLNDTSLPVHAQVYCNLGNSPSSLNMSARPRNHQMAADILPLHKRRATAPKKKAGSLQNRCISDRKCISCALEATISYPM